MTLLWCIVKLEVWKRSDSTWTSKTKSWLHRTFYKLGMLGFFTVKTQGNMHVSDKLNLAVENMHCQPWLPLHCYQFNHAESEWRMYVGLDESRISRRNNKQGGDIIRTMLRCCTQQEQDINVILIQQAVVLQCHPITQHSYLNAASF